MNRADQKMLKVLDRLKFDKTVRSDADFCRRIGMSPAALVKVKGGSQHFTVDHMESAVNTFGVNGNFIFGVERGMFRKPSIPDFSGTREEAKPAISTGNIK